jgi:hypothetical protein
LLVIIEEFHAMGALSMLKGLAKRFLSERSLLRYWRLKDKLQSWKSYRFTFPTATRPPQASAFPRIVAENNALEELGAKYQPTKRLHNYLMFYWMHFRDIRFQVKNLLEIGVQTDRSLRMWEEFFPNATVYGLDIDPKCKEIEGGRRKMFIGDQSDVGFLKRVVDQVGSFDIIIDDGSHLVHHQLATFNYLFPILTDHGIYVMEDTGGCVGDFSLRTVKTLQTLSEQVMYWPAEYQPTNWPYLANFPDGTPWADKNIIGVACYRWMVFVLRGKNPDDNPHLKPFPQQAAAGQRRPVPWEAVTHDLGPLAGHYAPPESKKDAAAANGSPHVPMSSGN